MRRFAEWLKTEAAAWQAAWRAIRDERTKHEDCVAVPLARYCDLLLSEQRSKTMALRLAVSIEERMRLEGANEAMCSALFSMNEDMRAPGLPDVARLELAPPVKKGFDA